MTSSRMERGTQIRAEVLGAEHVRRAQGAATDFDRPMQELVTEYCWGTVWDREALDRRTRSLLNIAMLAALGRAEELRAHVRGARTNGCSPEQIQEVLLQVAVYAGVPAGIEGFRVARAVLDDAKV
ncbi:carboxymuconolactone decarboxylase family protein [Pseudonocardia kujensis]|uniref:carboxymuconolactone decarboxylase family protein n=1 Tax=Pseudonocardia kujensis TaxID=1128675 RepID=UPI001E3C8B83|nr:carboxymuconolactone decarboxylase family protein [Pseudonocardia kujensis]MCE0764085.1 carboxymuconolactone decarboxylase family protein [Pseudonocardia kujensis]